MKREYTIEQLNCAGCGAKMEEKIGQLPGIRRAQLVFATKCLTVEGEDPDASLEQMQQICQSIEPEVQLIPRQKKREKKETRRGRLSKDQKRELLLIGASGILLAAGGILGRIWEGQIYGTILLVAAYLGLGYEVLWKAVRNMIRGSVFDENFLMSVATIAAMGMGEMMEAAGVMLFYRIGELFEDIAVERSRNLVMDAVDLRPEQVTLVKEGKTVSVPAEEAKPGDVILVRAGDRVPLDGKVVAGSGRMDTSAITGESVPVYVEEGMEVLSGCVNQNGMLHIRVEKRLEESMVSRILEAVEHAAASKPKIDRFLTRFARIYTPVVVGIALFTAILPSLIWGNPRQWIYTAVTFLVISCPCALVLSVPLAFFAGIGGAAKRGILFKGGAAMEALKEIKTVVLDKTGTLTNGKFVVQDVVSFGRLTRKQILTMAADCELHSSHPIGRSILEEANRQGLSLTQPETLEELPGKGIRAVFKEGIVLCGNGDWMKEEQVQGYTKSDGRGTKVFVAVNGILQGSVEVADQVKEEAKEAVREIKRQGLGVVMLTGDREAPAKEAAKAAGIEEVYAQLLPQEKLEQLQKIRKSSGTVLFVGDGINDAPVLANADVGAAMGSGADAAMEVADVVYMTSRVDAVTDSLAIAERTRKIVIQNVAGALGIKFLVMLLGFAGYANMWMAIFADTGVAMLCVLNAARGILNIRNQERQGKRAEMVEK